MAQGWPAAGSRLKVQAGSSFPKEPAFPRLSLSSLFVRFELPLSSSPLFGAASFPDGSGAALWPFPFSRGFACLPSVGIDRVTSWIQTIGSSDCARCAGEKEVVGGLRVGAEACEFDFY